MNKTSYYFNISIVACGEDYDGYDSDSYNERDVRKEYKDRVIMTIPDDMNVFDAMNDAIEKLSKNIKRYYEDNCGIRSFRSNWGHPYHKIYIDIKSHRPMLLTKRRRYDWSIELD